MKLGVCYYPEHWPRAWWRTDAARMAEIGIRRVRIGEFAWSRIEPEPGAYAWEWLDAAIETLAAAGLEVVLGTPTATPPKWLINAHPDILAVDRHGRPRKFGSRRHYCFSSETYRRESARIVTDLAGRYGAHPAVVAWQTDNEYGCHDTIESYSDSAARAFRTWLEKRYGDVAALNEAWGAVFWSQEYRSFAEVEPPNLTVTEANPAHRLDFQRFSSDQVVSYNRLQTDIIRAHAPGRDVVHNFMGFFTAFDHFDVAADLDAATWDSYPLGFLEQGWWPDETKRRFMRQGHPDQAAFHHDLYRGVGRGRWQVMEQQPGPVNWAPYNPAPLPGMVRLWTWEAFAHGAEVVSYFRWRQAPFAQEQMHAGLLRPDSVEDAAAREARQVFSELALAHGASTQRAPVALLFSYEAQWMLDIQRQGASFDYTQLCFEWYSAFRRLGLDVDILDPRQDLTGYALIAAPSLPIVRGDLRDRLLNSNAALLIGPRSGSKTEQYRIAEGLPPGALRGLLPITISRVESLRPNHTEQVNGEGAVTRWFEHVDGDAEVVERTAAGAPVWLQHECATYVAGWPDETLLRRICESVCARAGIETVWLPEALRLRTLGDLHFAFNYGSEPVSLDSVGATEGMNFVIGGPTLPPAGVAAWRRMAR
jgi:beta-galactosidase